MSYNKYVWGYHLVVIQTFAYIVCLFSLLSFLQKQEGESKDSRQQQSMGMPLGSSRVPLPVHFTVLRRQLTVEKQVEEVTTAAAVHSSCIPFFFPHHSFAKTPAGVLCLVYQSGLHESEHPLDMVAKRYRKPFLLLSNDHLRVVGGFFLYSYISHTWHTVICWRHRKNQLSPMVVWPAFSIFTLLSNSSTAEIDLVFNYFIAVEKLGDGLKFLNCHVVILWLATILHMPGGISKISQQWVHF